MTQFRDKVAWRTINFILNTVASKWYRDRVNELVAKGLNQETIEASKKGIKVLYVTPAQVEAAKLLIELEEGIGIDPAILAIANAKREEDE